MLSSFSEDSTIIGEDSSYFLCTCRAEFELISHYNRHLREVHQINSILIPDSHNQQRQLLSKTNETTLQSSGNMDVNVKLEDQEKKSISSPNRQKRSKEERREVMKALSRRQFNKRGFCFKEKTISWQGFKLIKNRQCCQEPYFCGNCETIFFEIENFITHCILECRTLIHQNSSHTITLNQKQEETSEDLQHIQDQDSNIEQSGKPQLATYSQAVINQPFKQILLQKLDHRSLPFYCGQCKINVLMWDYYKHILRKHGQKIGQDSSHIIVKCCINQSKRNIYLSPNVLWDHQEKSFFCLCNPTQKMSMKDFIQHVRLEHAGISPQYQLQARKRSWTYIVQKRQRKSRRTLKKEMPFPNEQTGQQIRLKQLQYIYDIIYKLQDHRKSIPFSCGNCPFTTFSSPICYKRHIQSYHIQQLSLSSSHVVLQMQNGKKMHDIYLSSNIKWYHDQLIYFCPCSIDKKMSMSSLLQHILTKHQGISPLYYRQIQLKRDCTVKDQKCKILDLMKRLRRRGFDHKITPYQCYPCNLELKNGLCYRTHMRAVHNNNIHPSSSHIILLFKKQHYKQRTMLVISPQMKWADAERSDYYCPCQPDKKITMETLVRHVIEVHKGVSPEYVFNQSTPNSQYFKAEQFIDQQEETSQDLSEIEDQESHQESQEYINPQQIVQSEVPSNQLFRQILRQNLDHRKVPFYCGQCKINTSIYNYYKHFQLYHGQKIDEASSHILVKCRYGPATRLIYLSPSTRWFNQDEKYYCICNHKEKMKMDDLILHIQAQHAGISPYFILQRQLYTTKRPLTKKETIQQTRFQQLQSSYIIKRPLTKNETIQSTRFQQLLSFQHIYDILYKLQDHKESLPFSCGYCPVLTFKSCSNYKKHLQTHRHAKMAALGSHVILQLQNGNENKKNVYLSPSIKWHNNEVIYFCPCELEKKMSMQILLQHIITEHQGISPPYFQQDSIKRCQVFKKQRFEAKDTMRRLRQGDNHKNVPFTCFPCSIELEDGHRYKTHMRKVHLNIIHPLSSHIILLFKKLRNKQRTKLLLSTNIIWTIGELSDYYCACMPEKKVTLQDLIQHVIQRHNGVSPEYSFNENIVNSQDTTTKSCLKAEEYDCLEQEQ